MPKTRLARTAAIAFFFLASVAPVAAAQDSRLGPRVLDDSSGISLRPPAGFLVDEDEKADGKPAQPEPGVVTPAIRLSKSGAGEIIVFARETEEDAVVSQVAAGGLGLVKSNFGAEQYAGEDDFSVAGFSGKSYAFTDLPKLASAECLLFVFGKGRTWFVAVTIFEKSRATDLRGDMRAAMATFDRFTPERLDEILGEPVLAPGSPLALRAPLGFWRASGERVPAGAALALVPAYSRAGSGGSLAVYLHENAATPLQLLDQAEAAIRGLDAKAAIREAKRITVKGREWRTVSFVAGDVAGVLLLTVEGAKGIRVEYRVSPEDIEAATDVTAPILVAADFASEIERRTRAAVGKDRYLATIKSGMPAAAAPFLVELARSGDAKEAAPVLVAALSEKPQPVRLAAARGLGALSAPEGLNGLKKIAESPTTKDPAEKAVQLAAIRALGEIGDPKANAALFKKLNEPDAAAFDVALEALARIGTPEKQIADQLVRAWGRFESPARNPKNADAKAKLEEVSPKFRRALAFFLGEEFEDSRAARAALDR